MATESLSAAAVVFTTKTSYILPSQKFMIPLDWKRYQLSQLINKALSLASPVPFDFLVRGAILRTTLGACRAEHGITEEDTLELEYFESVLPPQRMTALPHEDWVSSVLCRVPRHLMTASYDGHVRLFDHSRNLVRDIPAHRAAVTDVCIVKATTAEDDTLRDSSVLIASASHDLTASLVRVSLAPDVSMDEDGATSSRSHFRSLATLHLHTAPLTSVASDRAGSRLLTASWDHLVGVWDTAIPEQDEVEGEVADRKKRRRIANGNDNEVEERGRRKAPTAVLKSHTARVSRAVFGPSGSASRAYSCGFDATVRTWDVEMGVCMDTITVPERPMLDLAVTGPDGQTVLACSTDRTVSVFDLRSPSLASTAGTLVHPATPSCLVCPSAAAPSPNDSGDGGGGNASLALGGDDGAPRVLTGAYDGVARVWDLRSVRGAVASLGVWNGGGSGSDDAKKILSVDWAGEIVGVGGEGGMEVWRVGRS